MVNPDAFWAQRSSSTDPRKNTIFLHVWIKGLDPDTVRLTMEARTIVFRASKLEYNRQTGVTTRNVTFRVELYNEIVPEESTVRSDTVGVQMKLRKRELSDEDWPRLTNAGYPGLLRVLSDQEWSDDYEDDDDEDDEEDGDDPNDQDWQEADDAHLDELDTDSEDSTVARDPDYVP